MLVSFQSKKKKSNIPFVIQAIAQVFQTECRGPGPRRKRPKEKKEH